MVETDHYIRMNLNCTAHVIHLIQEYLLNVESSISSLKKMSIDDVKMGRHCGSYSKRCIDNDDPGAGAAIMSLSATQKGLELLDSVINFAVLPYQVYAYTQIPGPDARYISLLISRWYHLYQGYFLPACFKWGYIYHAEGVV